MCTVCPFFYLMCSNSPGGVPDLMGVRRPRLDETRCLHSIIPTGNSTRFLSSDVAHYERICISGFCAYAAGLHVFLFVIDCATPFDQCMSTVYPRKNVS